MPSPLPTPRSANRKLLQSCPSLQAEHLGFFCLANNSRPGKRSGKCTGQWPEDERADEYLIPKTRDSGVGNDVSNAGVQWCACEVLFNMFSAHNQDVGSKGSQ